MCILLQYRRLWQFGDWGPNLFSNCCLALCWKLSLGTVIFHCWLYRCWLYICSLVWSHVRHLYSLVACCILEFEQIAQGMNMQEVQT